MTDKIENGEFKEETAPKKTALQEMKDKIAVFQKLSLAWTIISLLFSTAYLIYSVFTKFGNPVYRYVSFGALGIYALIFLSLLIFAVEGKKKKRMLLKTYKTGISIFRAILNIVHTVLTVSVVLSSISGSEVNKVVSLLVAIFTIVFAALTIVFKLVTLILTNVIPKLAKLGAQIAKEAIDEKIKESKMLTNIVSYAKNKRIKNKEKADKRREKEEAAAEKKRVKEEKKKLKEEKKKEKLLNKINTSSEDSQEGQIAESKMDEHSLPSENSVTDGNGNDKSRKLFSRKKEKELIEKAACDSVTEIEEDGKTVGRGSNRFNIFKGIKSKKEK